MGRFQLWALGKFPRGCGSETKCVGSGPSPYSSLNEDMQIYLRGSSERLSVNAWKTLSTLVGT